MKYFQLYNLNEIFPTSKRSCIQIRLHTKLFLINLILINMKMAQFIATMEKEETSERARSSTITRKARRTILDLLSS